jgi:hypothetical protein
MRVHSGVVVQDRFLVAGDTVAYRLLIGERLEENVCKLGLGCLSILLAGCFVYPVVCLLKSS